MKTITLLLGLLLASPTFAQDASSPVEVKNYQLTSTYGGAASSGVTHAYSYQVIVKDDHVQFTGLLPQTDKQYSKLKLNKGDTLIVSTSTYSPYYDHDYIGLPPTTPKVTRSGNQVWYTLHENNFNSYRQIEELDKVPLGVYRNDQFHELEFPELVEQIFAMP